MSLQLPKSLSLLFGNASEVSADKIINAILIKTAACPGAFSTTYKFEIANTARPAAAQLLFLQGVKNARIAHS